MKIDSPTAIGTSTGFGIPTGGTAGQMLIKNSSTNYDTIWTGTTPTLVQATNTSGQSIGNNVSPSIIVTGWTNLTTQNATEWNPTTGVFTATKSGTYLVSSNLTYAAKSANQSGNVSNVSVFKNSTAQSISTIAALNTASVIRAMGTAIAIVNLAIGDTITIRTYHDLVGTATLSTTTGLNNVTIQQIESTIIN
jgi:hypothetical protein